MDLQSMAVYDRLLSAGVSDKAAKAHAKIYEHQVETQLASKQDIKHLELQIKQVDKEIQQLRADLKRDMQARVICKHEMLTQNVICMHKIPV